MSRENKEIIVGLDIGTSKVVALVAEIRPRHLFSVRASPATPCQ